MILGIDPGKSGGLAFIAEDGRIESISPMPDLYSLPSLAGVKRCFIEKCQSMPGQGVQSMFNYGQHFGQILGLLWARKISHVLVNPRVWQRKMLGSFSKGESKKAALAKALQLWPEQSFVPPRRCVPHDGMVDAALIAEYGRLYG